MWRDWPLHTPTSLQTNCVKGSQGQPRNKVATLVLSLRTKDPVEVQWQDEAVEDILNDTLVTLYGIKSAAADAQGAVLGPTLTTIILVEGIPAKALLDTKSPVTIVLLDFLVKRSPNRRSTVTMTPSDRK